ncbi:uncharacterized protein LOC116850754 [Odontomachus brunneus]|uniref:uncharacterized protein LOC116850754 n=1 Tax=Odontomachus brunneus TaxID=486640 RepID=UPI0013F283D6|nr:uncharacterized protein LOC116850754 [Odontomachus brunneus]
MTTDKIVTFNGPYSPDKYNQFFNPNICHICKLPSRNLITCIKCSMISYCCHEHQTLHKYWHLYICKSLARIISDKSNWNAYLNLSQWLISRKEIIIKINRLLPQHELEMITLAKSCFKCYRQINIKPCVICYSANFCDDHQMLFNIEHKDKCKELLLLLNLNIVYMKGNTLCLSKLEFIKFPDARPYHNMITFINRYLVMESLDNNQKKLYFPIQTFWSFEHYICSDYVSDPLTLHYALQESNLLFLPRTAVNLRRTAEQLEVTQQTISK